MTARYGIIATPNALMAKLLQFGRGMTLRTYSYIRITESVGANGNQTKSYEEEIDKEAGDAA